MLSFNKLFRLIYDQVGSLESPALVELEQSSMNTVRRVWKMQEICL
jgi:hypothetical protein